MAFCLYFQARVVKKETWFFVATLRFHEHMAFDRTLDVTTGVFEFFVPEAYQERFLTFMRRMEREGVVSEVIQLPNRLSSPGAIF